MTRSIETLCVGCLAPSALPEDVVRAAIAGQLPTTFYCDDDLAYCGVAIARPSGECACGNPGLIVRTLPSVEAWVVPDGPGNR